MFPSYPSQPTSNNVPYGMVLGPAGWMPSAGSAPLGSGSAPITPNFKRVLPTQQGNLARYDLASQPDMQMIQMQMHQQALLQAQQRMTGAGHMRSALKSEDYSLLDDGKGDAPLNVFDSTTSGSGSVKSTSTMSNAMPSPKAADMPVFQAQGVPEGLPQAQVAAHMQAVQRHHQQQRRNVQMSQFTSRDASWQQQMLQHQAAAQQTLSPQPLPWLALPHAYPPVPQALPGFAMGPGSASLVRGGHSSGAQFPSMHMIQYPPRAPEQLDQRFDKAEDRQLSPKMIGIPQHISNPRRSALRDIGPLHISYFQMGKFVGRGGAIRFFLLGNQIQHTFEDIEIKTWDYRKQQMIESGHYPLAQLPTMVHNQNIMFECMPMLRYLAKMLGQYGKNDQDDYYTDIGLERVAYFRDEVMAALGEYSNNGGEYETEVFKHYLSVRECQYNIFETLLEHVNRPRVNAGRCFFFGGTKATYTDFALFSCLYDDMKLMEPRVWVSRATKQKDASPLGPNLLSRFPRVHALYESIGKLPLIENWIAHESRSTKSQQGASSGEIDSRLGETERQNNQSESEDSETQNNQAKWSADGEAADGGKWVEHTEASELRDEPRTSGRESNRGDSVGITTLEMLSSNNIYEYPVLETPLPRKVDTDPADPVEVSGMKEVHAERSQLRQDHGRSNNPLSQDSPPFRYAGSPVGSWSPDSPENFEPFQRNLS